MSGWVVSGWVGWLVGGWVSGVSMSHASISIVNEMLIYIFYVFYLLLNMSVQVLICVFLIPHPSTEVQ